MKTSTVCKILFGMNIFLIIFWPLTLIGSTSILTAFIVGAIWMTDIYDAIREWKDIRHYTAMGD